MAGALYHHILTLKSDEGTFPLTDCFCWASFYSPQPYATLRPTHSSGQLSWLHSEKKAFIYYMISRLETTGVGPANFAVNVGEEILEGNGQEPLDPSLLIVPFSSPEMKGRCPSDKADICI